MRNFLIAIAGFVIGGVAVIGGVLALPQHTTATPKAAPAQAAMPMTHMSGMAMRGSGMTTSVAARTPLTRHLTIQHVVRGCHVWSNGMSTGAFMRLNLRPGQRLSIIDQDVDAHQLLQFGGPVQMRMGEPMMMNHGVTLTFTKAGIYRLGTKTVEMPGGMSTDVKTIGPDNKLRLLVTVA